MAVTAVAALVVCASAFAFTPPPFPRLGGVEYGNPFDYNDTGYQAQLAKLSIVLLNYYPGMAPGGESMDSIVQAIHGLNPNTLVFLYVQSDYQNPYGAPDSVTDYRDKMNTMKWWLYSNTSFSSPVATRNSTTWYTINNSPYTPKDSSGNDSIDWITKWYVSKYFDPIPHIDGFFMDNVFVQPNVAGDWYRDNQDLQPSNPKAQAAIQAGYERYFSLVRTLMPGKYQLGNVAEWGINAPVPSGYVGMADGGLLEGMILVDRELRRLAGDDEPVRARHGRAQGAEARHLRPVRESHRLSVVSLWFRLVSHERCLLQLHGPVQRLYRRRLVR
jgi:hypothetical protein